MFQTRLGRLQLVLALVVVAVSAGCPRGSPQPPEHSAPGVLLTLASATAERWADGDVLVRCSATLQNYTGRELTVRTNFHSAFDAVSVVLLRPDGTELVRQAYNYHQSPYAEDQAIPLPPGSTTEVLGFPLVGLPADLDGVVVRLEGGLPGTEYADGLESDPVPLEWGPAQPL